MFNPIQLISSIKPAQLISAVSSIQPTQLIGSLSSVQRVGGVVGLAAGAVGVFLVAREIHERKMSPISSSRYSSSAFSSPRSSSWDNSGSIARTLFVSGAF